jgi:hypothetical protein
MFYKIPHLFVKSRKVMKLKWFIAPIALFLSITAFAIPVYANPASMVVEPQVIAQDQTSTIIFCQGGNGCNYPVTVNNLTVTDPNSVTYTYNGGAGCPTGTVPFTISSGEVDIPFGTGASDSSCWSPAPSTHATGDYIVASSGTEGRVNSPFTVSTDFFVVPEGPIGVIGLVSALGAGLATLAIARRRLL